MWQSYSIDPWNSSFSIRALGRKLHRDRKVAANQACESKILIHNEINTLFKTYKAVGALDRILVLRQYNAYDNDNCRL